MREYIIVGSVAAIANGVILNRTPKDCDIFSTEAGVVQCLEDHRFNPERTQETEKGRILWSADGRILEVELVEKCENIKAIYERMMTDSSGQFATPEWLYFLKMSHRYKKDSPHFMKTMKDILTMRYFGVKMPEGSEELFKERERLTYTYNHPKLNVNKDNFFKGDQVPYKYDHDSIHRVVALDGTPAYTKYMKDGEQVMCSKEKFYSVGRRVRLLGGLEESLVLTAERSLIPNDFKPNADRMFLFALQKVCTSITSGWFREYCWENYTSIVSLYRRECEGVWVEKLKKGIDNGDVLPYDGKLY